MHYFENDPVCAAKEVVVAYHSVQHKLRFRTSDCTSRLLKHIFEPKFSAARTKTEAIITNVISPQVYSTRFWRN